ncbi:MULTISPECIES: DUF1802 family protein [unclassified Tolypothrix]|uniref:DUF1802 family protein n=1 Tax=unclassified Tolypothrix TaxID=2649714 RepID=UPI0005EAB162|nr:MULTISPECIES: DUF1802 family protein [unclassified Tolypothrix]BAY95471.1 hypothetical protein NIES3275_75280 [Microchaete diplosiphon NIES-3275]EKF00718.1 hypothetical protein FDUTEX481_08868 [Tolypothrix sp. PCC 7601]MBE9084608.1 DUF1802 family protein [Tolypothrix sp. LEGE 11397]UYD28627.1 DUF1802 family protein [Tolypothrix sp. PCC 7712]UYD35461.1 DUF1802 family protein [Tolypothrix sp. PCC 7601]
MNLTTTFHALKEWAVAIDALENGNTIMLLRKGGIHEQNGLFQVAHHQVLLYPTFEHQQTFLLKSEYANLVCPVTSGWHPETVRIGSWAEITDILPVRDESTVNKLLPFHIWNEHFISDRLKWKARQPLYILLLRTYKLAKIQEIPYLSQYGGCKSWIDLAQPIDISAAEPVLSESSYQQLVGEIRTIVGDKLYAPSL